MRRYPQLAVLALLALLGASCANTEQAAATRPASSDADVRTRVNAFVDAWHQDAAHARPAFFDKRSEEHTSELQSQSNLVCRLLLEKKKLEANERQADATSA